MFQHQDYGNASPPSSLRPQQQPPPQQQDYVTSGSNSPRAQQDYDTNSPGLRGPHEYGGSPGSLHTDYVSGGSPGAMRVSHHDYERHAAAEYAQSSPLRDYQTMVAAQAMEYIDVVDMSPQKYPDDRNDAAAYVLQGNGVTDRKDVIKTEQNYVTLPPFLG